VAARQGEMLAVAFHAELGDDDRLHRLFLEPGFSSLANRA
jgi:glutamine amidotransferase PdxT